MRRIPVRERHGRPAQGMAAVSLSACGGHHSRAAVDLGRVTSVQPSTADVEPCRWFLSSCRPSSAPAPRDAATHTDRTARRLLVTSQPAVQGWRPTNGQQLSDLTVTSEPAAHDSEPAPLCAHRPWCTRLRPRYRRRLLVRRVPTRTHSLTHSRRPLVRSVRIMRKRLMKSR